MGIPATANCHARPDGHRTRHRWTRLADHTRVTDVATPCLQAGAAGVDTAQIPPVPYATHLLDSEAPVTDNDPSSPLGEPREPRPDAERNSDPTDPDTEDAILRERGPGGHEEELDDEANLRADPTAPGVDNEDEV